MEHNLPDDNLPTPKKNKGAYLPRQWAHKLALVALVVQVLMPLGNALAAEKFKQSGPISANTLALCTQFGIQIKSITPDDGAPNAKTMWDCPICQLQIGSDTPKPLMVTFSVNMGDERAVEFGASDILANGHCQGPNQPRAPPAA